MDIETQAWQSTGKNIHTLSTKMLPHEFHTLYLEMQSRNPLAGLDDQTRESFWDYLRNGVGSVSKGHLALAMYDESARNEVLKSINQQLRLYDHVMKIDPYAHSLLDADGQVWMVCHIISPAFPTTKYIRVYIADDSEVVMCELRADEGVFIEVVTLSILRRDPVMRGQFAIVLTNSML